MGPVELSRPKLRDTDESSVRPALRHGVTRTNALETLVISCWVRGLSDRDIEAMLARGLRRRRQRLEVDGQPHLPAPTGRSSTPGTGETSPSSEVDYLYLDGSIFKMHQKAKAEPVLAAWGIDTDGTPLLLGLARGYRVDRSVARLPRGPQRARPALAAARRLRRRHRG